MSRTSNRGVLKRILTVFAAAMAAIAMFATVRTLRYGSPAVPVAVVPTIPVAQGAAERLAGALRFPTVSGNESETEEAFDALHAYLASSFPRVHAQLHREVIGGRSLLYTWKGTHESLNPILLMAHLDVVPVEPGTEDKWQYAPFAGKVANGFIWGRGAIDNKSAVVGMLEAVQMLLEEGLRPARTMYLAYGHDEEVGGTQGAREIAALLQSRGVQLDMVLDEGGVVGDGLLPGLSRPVALVGIAEKGFLTVELSVRASGGHSSLPPSQSTIGILSAAIARLEANPMPARFEAATRQLFEGIGPQLPFFQRALFANLWLTRPIVLRAMEDGPGTNAMIRTTTAVTIFQAGTKDNVLPSSAQAMINFRILPGDNSDQILQHVRRVIDDDRIEVKTAGAFSAEPSQVSSTTSQSFRILDQTIRSTIPDASVAPYLVVVVTDSRYFAGLSRDIYRFLPLRLTSRDLERMHGTDERLSIDQYEAAIRFYRQLILTAGRESL